MNQINNEAQFKEYTNQPSPVVVKYYADWCPDCKRMDAFMPSVLEEFKKVPLVSLNKETLPEITEQQQVMGIPSLLVYQDGQKVDHLHSANAKTPDQVKQFLSKYF